METVSVAMTAAPKSLPILSTIFKLSTDIRETSERVETNKSQCEQLSERIDTLIGFLAERDLSRCLNEAMHIALNRFEAFLRRCLEYISTFLETGWFKRIVNNKDFEKKFQDLNRELTQYSNDLNFGIGLNNMQSTKKQEENHYTDNYSSDASQNPATMDESHEYENDFIEKKTAEIADDDEHSGIAARQVPPSGKNSPFVNTARSAGNIEQAQQSVFISGLWNYAYNQYNLAYGPFPHQLVFNSTTRKLHGYGEDNVGQYILNGTFSEENRQMEMTQSYQYGTGNPTLNLGHQDKMQLNWNAQRKIFEGVAYSNVQERRCRCLSNNSSCWPNASVWQTFNESINGQLIFPKPSAAVCNSNPPNVNACITVTEKWPNSFWRSEQAGAMQSAHWENSSCSIFFNSTTCNQGSVPILAVNATLPEHVQATLQLVNRYNLRLVIKTTGHDFSGRSTANGALLLWLHHMKNFTFINNTLSCTGENISNAIRIGAGIQWGEVYKWLAQYNLVAIGGASSTVGASGGFLQGGGHSLLSRWKGFAADQVIEYDVIMADGRRQTVNSCQNVDLFWALRGGGGGTFAVVLSVTLRTYPSPSMISCIHFLKPPNNTRYASFVHHFVQLLPTLADSGWAGYFYLTMETFTLVFFLPNGNNDIANTTINQLMNNFTDFNFKQPAYHSYPTFISFFVKILESSSATGNNVILGSRLIPEIIIRNQPNQVADTFLQVKDGNGSLLIGHLVAGGKASDTTQNNSINPAWRTALLHMIYARSWNDSTSIEDQEKLAKLVTEKVEILQTIAGGSQSGSYMNEADPNERDWQQKFFGSLEIYNRLKSIKDNVDPNGIFQCRQCIGSDDWSIDLNCPKISNGNKCYLVIQLLLIVMSFLFNFKI
ncbi:unnamed protein product [Adineta steineri]|uniref:FAD-binding PCMH-type domain-containing protein n=1 Tax=Adineta steineri TaxID=433720 RepID=A0A815EDN0_9BILA|nr:unnamed protein product [Adineta steineri]